MSVKDVLFTLNKLVATTKDGENGYKACAHQVRSPELRALLLRRADDCHLAARELRMHIALLGGNAKSRGSANGTLHRIWLALRASIPGYSDQDILGECERGQGVALARYRTAMKSALPWAERHLVEYQFRGVLRHYDEIRNLRIGSLRPRTHSHTLHEPAM